MLTRDSLLTVAGVSEPPSSTILPFSHIHPKAHLTTKHIVSKGGVSTPVFDNIKEQSASSGDAPLLLINIPMSMSLNEGDDLFLSAAAYGSEPLNYQWKKNNIDITGATSSVYQKFNVQASDEAAYKCVVTNVYGSTVSHVCEVTVVTAVTQYTVDFTAGAGGSISGSTSQLVDEGDDCTAVEAMPNEGYEFNGWTEDVTSSENPLTVHNVVTNMNITANFILIPPVGPNMNVLNYYYNQMNE
jgi:uncharacterized repeat protein (TIGR02543 family)